MFRPPDRSAFSVPRRSRRQDGESRSRSSWRDRMCPAFRAGRGAYSPPWARNEPWSGTGRQSASAGAELAVGGRWSTPTPSHPRFRERRRTLRASRRRLLRRPASRSRPFWSLRVPNRPERQAPTWPPRRSRNPRRRPSPSRSPPSHPLPSHCPELYPRTARCQHPREASTIRSSRPMRPLRRQRNFLRFKAVRRLWRFRPGNPMTQRAPASRPHGPSRHPPARRRTSRTTRPQRRNLQGRASSRRSTPILPSRLIRSCHRHRRKSPSPCVIHHRRAVWPRPSPAHVASPGRKPGPRPRRRWVWKACRVRRARHPPSPSPHCSRRRRCWSGHPRSRRSG